jgi:ankyrin repeat protein
MSMINYLVSQGADVSAEMIDERTPLLEVVSGTEEEAKQTGRVQLVRALLALGADPSQGDVSGRTPLHCACFDNHDKMIKALQTRTSSRPTTRESPRCISCVSAPPSNS